jgi:hypothetical protein
MTLACARLYVGGVALAAALALGGCLDPNSTEVRVNGSVSTDVTHRSGASPRGASVTFATLDGPPEAVSARFAKDLAAAASQNDVSIADAKSAHYVVRGYLTAYPSQEGTEVSYVWDVFDAAHHRAQRVTDAVDIQGSAEDPWSLVDDEVLGRVAAKSVGDLASFLATTPEALAFAAHAASAKSASAEPDPHAVAQARPLSYAAAE